MPLYPDTDCVDFIKSECTQKWSKIGKLGPQLKMHPIYTVYGEAN